MNDFLHPYGNLDVLGRYSKVAPLLTNFLKNKEIATKIVGEKFVVLKRWTKNTPLYIHDFKHIDEIFLQLRAEHHLDNIKEQLSPKQVLIWQYFVPRKLVNFFYACNNEYWSFIDRIFIDIDRQTNSADDARKVASELVQIIQKDKTFTSLIPGPLSLLNLWTGSSFHIYVLLKKTINHDFYDRYLSYGKGKEDSFISRRAAEVSKATKLKVLAWHERKKWAIILDTSNTPPGKLARCPFSLHIKDNKTIDGICVPVSQEELRDSKLITKLQHLTPEYIREHRDTYKKLLP